MTAVELVRAAVTVAAHVRITIAPNAIRLELDIPRRTR